MHNILRKRIWREFKQNLLRYLALGFLVFLGMYIVVSLVGAADTIIYGVDNNAEKRCLEDGEFTVFVPLTKAEEKKLIDTGAELEKMFYMDFAEEDDSTLRVFQIRSKINQIALDKGKLAKNKDEVVIEKRYCQEQDIQIGDSLVIGSQKLRVTGIGSVPDYDAPYRNLSDSSVDSKQFGLAFVTKEMYQTLKESGKSDKSEEYVYSYRLNGRLDEEELKETIRELKVSPENVDDVYFQDYWEENFGEKEEYKEAIQSLVDGSKKLRIALKKLDSYQEDFNEGAENVFASYLEEANRGLSEYSLSEKMTEDNFEQLLDELETSSDSAVFRLSVRNLSQELKALKAYKDGVIEYTDGVNKTTEGAEELEEGVQRLKSGTDKFLENYFDNSLTNLTQFLTAQDNPRIKASADDQVINKLSGLAAGVIVMILFTYVISVFVIHGIEQESTVIGALYALGVKRKDLLIHYLLLPMAVTMAGGVLGTILGYSPWGVAVQTADCYAYYSLPKLHTIYSSYLIIYGMVMPPAVALLVNWLVIRKRLSRPALALLRSEQKAGKVWDINLGNIGFTGRFRIRQMLREARTGLTVIFGMFISMLILMLGVNCYVLCENISIENKADTKFEYMYTYKYPEKEVPDGGEACYTKILKKEIFGNNLDVTLMGIDKKNPYFDAEVTDKKNEVVISSAMSQKYNLSQGDKVVLSDDETDMDYVFTVQGITQYSLGMYAFMDIDAMRDFFGEAEDYYNVILSDKPLAIPTGRLYATISKEEISKGSDVFTSLMMPMVITMLVVAALIFCMVMYLMMKVMIDRSAFSISLIKVFGYRQKEIRKLYLNGNFYMIAAGAAICMPLSKLAMDAMYPVLVSNIACGINLTFSIQLYLGIYVAILVLYFVINQMLIRRINKVLPAEVLKNRE